MEANTATLGLHTYWPFCLMHNVIWKQYQVLCNINNTTMFLLYVNCVKIHKKIQIRYCHTKKEVFFSGQATTAGPALFHLLHPQKGLSICIFLLPLRKWLFLRLPLLNKTLHFVFWFCYIIHKTVKKNYQIISNDYNFFRP